jgi:transglutaminase-like putative cysteine protease
MKMKNKLVLPLILILSIGQSFASDPKYPVSSIAEELKKDVNVVFREDIMIFKIISKNKASHYVHRVITILNPKGKQYASEEVGYDKLRKIKDFNATVYDADGKQIKRLKNNEIYDQSSFDGLYSDDRLKSIDLSQGQYPYTVEIEYEVEYKFLFYIPSFVVVPAEKISVEHSLYSLQYPKILAPRYTVSNITIEPKKEKTTEGLESLIWEFRNIKPIKFEPHSLIRDALMLISAAPSAFEYDNYSGVMDTWNSYGLWIASLNKGRNVLPESTKLKARQLTEKLKIPEEKIKALYEYLQSKTRYVSIQLGIGGYQPFEASVVDETGYGDCKALSNYMVALLESIGIKANYVLINAGGNAGELKVDFPSTQFNHVIVAVPNGADTLWLECTSQINPFGYQGKFTGDRKALLITDHGGKIVNTTQYTAHENLQSRIADVFVQPTGDAKATVKTIYTGLEYENDNLDFILNDQYDDQKKWIQNNTDIPSFDINTFSLSNQKAKIPSAVVNLDLTLKRYATVSGKRLFITPNLMNRSTYIPEKTESRKSSVVTRVAYTHIDSIRYHIPEEIYPEFLPQPIKLTTRFGDYESSFKIENGSLLYVRKVKRNKGTFPPETYSELVDFYKSISKADQTKLVFLNKT